MEDKRPTTRDLLPIENWQVLPPTASAVVAGALNLICGIRVFVDVFVYLQPKTQYNFMALTHLCLDLLLMRKFTIVRLIAPATLLDMTREMRCSPVYNTLRLSDLHKYYLFSGGSRTSGILMGQCC